MGIGRTSPVTGAPGITAIDPDPGSRKELRRLLAKGFADYLTEHPPEPDKPPLVHAALFHLAEEYNLPLNIAHVPDTLLSDDPERWAKLIAHRRGPPGLDDHKYRWPPRPPGPGDLK